MPEHILDFRSDTLTLPSKEMLQSVQEAPLGDDVFGEDSTVNALQEDVAKLLGKESALYVPSGTMGNLICAMAHCWERGREILYGDRSHMCLYEQGGTAQLGGIHGRNLKNLHDGTFSIDEMISMIRRPDVHFTVTGLVCIENTHNMMGGKVLPLEWVDKVGEVCRELNIPMHLDGARVFNAAVAMDVPVSRLTQDFASVSICLSKGLGAPVGSMIAGNRDFIERAKRLRKVLGGAMRQVGVVAVMGQIAIRDYKKTLLRDHEHLKKITKAIEVMNSKSVSVDTKGTHTNILLIKCNISVITPDELVSRLSQTPEKELKVLGASLVMKSLPVSATEVRLVMYWNITEQDVDLAIKKLTYVISELDKSN